MSLAATLAASGMRPASFIPTIKCSHCGDEIEISAMGEHQCSPEPLSPTTAHAMANNAFGIRQMNASEKKPTQLSHLQFSADPPPAMSMGRPRAPTVGSNHGFNANQTNGPKPTLPRINAAVANQPFLGPTTQAPTTTQGPISPASSVRSGSSGSSKRPLQRAVSKPVPRIFDPRPPSPELTANMDCAFPPFPTTPNTSERKPSSASSHRRKKSGDSSSHRRKESGASSSHRHKHSSESRSSRKNTRRDLDNTDVRSPTDGSGDYAVGRSDTKRSDRSGTTSRPSSKDGNLMHDMRGLDQWPSHHGEMLTPVEEHPPPSLSIPIEQNASAESFHTSMSAEEQPPLSLSIPIEPSASAESFHSSISAQEQPPLTLSIPIEQSASAESFHSSMSVEEHPPLSLSVPIPQSASAESFHSSLSPFPEARSPGLLPSSDERKEVPDQPAKSEEGQLSISHSIRRAVSRKLSLKKVVRSKSTRSEESAPALPAIITQPFEHQSGQRRIPPQRPARPDEGLPPDLLYSLSTREFSEHAGSPLPLFLQDSERSQTLPVPARTFDELLSPNTLSKMQSEPAMRTKAESTDTTQSQAYLTQDPSAGDSRMDYRMQDAPPVPKPTQLHRSESWHKSSDSSTSTMSSILSLGDISLGTSNTTSGTSPIASATSSVDAYLPFMSESARSSADESLRVAALNIKPQQILEGRGEPTEEVQTPTTITAPQTYDTEEAGEELSLETSRSSTNSTSWPLESPTDPSLQEGKLFEAFSSPRSSPSDATLTAPDSQKLERLSSDVYDPKRPSFSSSATEEEQHSVPQSEAITNSDFLGFNFEMPSPVQLNSSGTSPARSPLEATPMSPQPSPNFDDFSGAHMQSPELSRPPEVDPDQDTRPALLRSGTIAKRPICRGCSKRIEGKSVKAADGRLTGRWHKPCFVCETCKLPFETAQFYVLNNLPYCEQHYHEENDSVCHGCHTGIEGQFFQTSSGPDGAEVRKYHRRCFTCVECRLVLSDNYFEVDGRIHCERHAFAAMRSHTRKAPPGPPGYPSSRLRAESIQGERQRTRPMQY